MCRLGFLKTPQYYTDITKTLGWSYVDCGNDSYDDRTFSSLYDRNSTETVEDCVKYCATNNYVYAGLEYGNQCYCSNTLVADRAPIPGAIGFCSMPCAGNSDEICGGSSGISIYTKCTGLTCINAVFDDLGSNTVADQSNLIPAFTAVWEPLRKLSRGGFEYGSMTLPALWYSHHGIVAPLPHWPKQCSRSVTLVSHGVKIFRALSSIGVLC